MRILLSAYACEPGKGSEPAVGWNWMLALAEQGHHVSVVTRQNNRASIEPQITGRNLPVTPIYYDLPAWCRVWKHWPGGLYFYYLLWQVGAYLHVQTIHKQDPFDLVHHITFVTFRQPSFMGGLGIPFIFGPVGGGETSPRHLRVGMSLSGRVRERLRDILIGAAAHDPLMNHTFTQAALIACTTSETLQRIPSRFHSKCIVLPAIGVAPPTQASLAPLSPTFLFIGRLLYWKGLHLALRAMPEVIRRLPSARLKVVGEGRDSHWLRCVAEENGVSAHVDWVSHLPHEEISTTYAEGHTALVFPSLHDSGGLVVLEALAAQLPVICLDLGGPGFFVDSSCGIAIKTNGQSEDAIHRSLACAMVELALNPELQGALAANCSARARLFSWSETVRQLYSAFDTANRGSATTSSVCSNDDRIRIQTQAR